MLLGDDFLSFPPRTPSHVLKMCTMIHAYNLALCSRYGPRALPADMAKDSRKVCQGVEKESRP